MVKSLQHLKQMIQKDSSFSEGLHKLRTTEEASRFCHAHNIDVTPEQLWRQRGVLFEDGHPPGGGKEAFGLVCNQSACKGPFRVGNMNHSLTDQR